MPEESICPNAIVNPDVLFKSLTLSNVGIVAKACKFFNLGCSIKSDPQALYNPRPQPASKTSLILLDNNPFTTVIYSGTTYVNVFSEDHQRAAGSVVRFRGPPEVTAVGPGGDSDDTPNLQQFQSIPTFDNVSDLNNANGFTIALGQIDSAGNVTGATTTDPLTQPINYFHITSTSNATTGGVSGGGDNCSAGPVTLEVVNG